MKEKVVCLEMNGKYLVMHKNGDSKVLSSEKEFNEYLTKNNCEVKK